MGQRLCISREKVEMDVRSGGGRTVNRVSLKKGSMFQIWKYERLLCWGICVLLTSFTLEVEGLENRNIVRILVEAIPSSTMACRQGVQWKGY